MIIVGNALKRIVNAVDTAIESEVRAVLGAHAKLAVDAATMDPRADLHAAGMTSHSTVGVMLGLEDAFDIEFPERLLRKATFASVSAIVEAVTELRPTAC